MGSQAHVQGDTLQHLGICMRHGILHPCVLCKDKSQVHSELAVVPHWKGSEHWAELHTKQDSSKEWFADWLSRIPKWRCDCANKLTPWLAANPPRFGSDWFEFTRELHNFVNQDLKRPEMTLDEASKRWASPFAWKDVSGQKVGFVAVDFMRIGGTETFYTTLIPRLKNVIGFAVQNMIFGDTKPLGVPAYHGCDAIRSLCNESDVIVSWLVNPRDYGFTGKVIMVHHGSSIDEGQTAACLRDWLARHDSYDGDEIVCVSKATADHLRGITDKPVHYIPNAVDPARIVARNQIDLPAKKLCVWMHRFAVDKRPELAIQIADHLPSDWHMVLAGGGRALKGSERVTILPPVHPGDLLTQASCFLSTSKFDGFGLSVAEAICAGVPVVSSPAGIATEPGLATIVDHDAEPQEWAAAIVLAAQKVDRPQLPAEYGLDRHVEAWARVVGLP